MIWPGVKAILSTCGVWMTQLGSGWIVCVVVGREVGSAAVRGRVPAVNAAAIAVINANDADLILKLSNLNDSTQLKMSIGDPEGRRKVWTACYRGAGACP